MHSLPTHPVDACCCLPPPVHHLLFHAPCHLALCALPCAREHGWTQHMSTAKKSVALVAPTHPWPCLGLLPPPLMIPAVIAAAHAPPSYMLENTARLVNRNALEQLAQAPIRTIIQSSCPPLFSKHSLPMPSSPSLTRLLANPPYLNRNSFPARMNAKTAEGIVYHLIFIL